MQDMHACSAALLSNILHFSPALSEGLTDAFCCRPLGQRRQLQQL